MLGPLMSVGPRGRVSTLRREPASRTQSLSAFGCDRSELWQSQHSPARRHLDRCDATAVQHHEPIAVSGAQHAGILGEHRDDVLHEVGIVDDVWFVVREIHPIAAQQSDTHHRGRHVVEPRRVPRLATSVSAPRVMTGGFRQRPTARAWLPQGSKEPDNRATVGLVTHASGLDCTPRRGVISLADLRQRLT